jgi:hypothetical protein
MSSYATYCRDQATDCARRARLARSADIAAYYEGLGLRWLRLAEHAQGTGGVVGQASEAIGGVEPSCLRLRRTTQHMRKPQEAISGTLAALRSIASSLIEFAEVFRAIGITASTQGASRPGRAHEPLPTSPKMGAKAPGVSSKGLLKRSVVV